MSSPPSIWPEGVERVVLEQVRSTMEEAFARTKTSRHPQWILAKRQESGHGRRGRPWVSREGNFTATYLCFPNEPPAQMALRSFVAALALYDALSTVTGRPQMLSLKWPNDVLYQSGKIAGILLENGPDHLSVGIGVNLAYAPDPSDVEAQALRPVSLGGDGYDISPEAFLDVLAPAYAAREAQFNTYGFPPIREAWLARAVKLGEEIRARSGREDVTGIFETIDEAGNLVLRTGAQRRTMAAAEVYF